MNFDEWFQSKQGTPYYSYYDFAKDAWNAAQAAEREECLAEIETGIWFDNTTSEILDSIANAIKERGAK